VLEAAYSTVLILGALHGLEPGHGWPVALLYSIRTKHPLTYGLISSSIIASLHLISSVAIVAAYMVLNIFLAFELPWIKYVSAAALFYLAYRFFREKVPDTHGEQHGHYHDDTQALEHEHEHEHDGIGKHSHFHYHAKQIPISLYGIASFALILGFVHEEEFALLALAVGGVNPLLLMLTYASSVAASLIGITLAAVIAFDRIQGKIQKYERYLPKISGVLLALMGIFFLTGVM
jgi:ABC-type nickel/cobalt efflux system permease component RcnA